MWKNYLLIAWRNLFRHKTHAAINIVGLSIGIAVSILIGIWVWDELTFDQQGDHHRQIAQVVLHTKQNGDVQSSNTVAAPLAEALRTHFRDEFKSVTLARQTGEHLLHYGDKTLRQPGKFISEEGTGILPLTLISGEQHGLKDPKSIMLSQSTANALFGGADPLGKILKVDNDLLVNVSGIYKDFPSNSSFKEVNYLLPWKLLTASNPDYRRLEKSWEFNWFEVFVEVHPNNNITSASQKIANLQQDLLKDHVNLARYNPQLSLHPMDKWHLYSEWKNGENVGGRIQNIWLFITIGVFVLLLASVNFMNLSTAQSQRRAKEVGIRKAIGSARSQLIIQFFYESMLIVLICFVFALALAKLALPAFNALVEKQLSIPFTDRYFWMMASGFMFLLGLSSGSYPALFLSSFKPIKVLKGIAQGGSGAALPRQILVVFQYTVSISLMIATVIILQQIQYAKERPVGYERNGLISFRMNQFNGRNEAFREDLLKTGLLSEVAQATSPATDIWSNTSGFYWEGKAPEFKDNFSLIAISPSYGKTMGWEVIEGRDFSTDFVSDSSAVILNESAITYMRLKDPVGKTIRWKDETFNDTEYRVIGVVKDMVMQSPYDPVHQTIYFMQPAANFLLAKIKPGVDVREALLAVQGVFKQHAPEEAFEYTFVEDEYAQKFVAEEQTGKLAAVFTALTFLISCLGIFGLASFATEQRRKEIGIRKVLGAGLAQITRLLSANFIKLVLIAVLIASPIAWWAMNRWLEDFTYRIEAAWWVFAAIGLLTVGVAFLTISFQTIKAALANPVDALRNE